MPSPCKPDCHELHLHHTHIAVEHQFGALDPTRYAETLDILADLAGTQEH
jgi:hypothetical protein